MNWFRSRRSNHTAEPYLHTREELKSKHLVTSIVSQVEKVRKLRNHITELVGSNEFNEIIHQGQFVSPKPDSNPFPRTQS